MIFLSFFPVIENLPVEMRERLTEMRETDLQVQSKFFDIFKIACVLSCPLIAEQLFFPSRHYLPWRILVCCKRLFPLCRIPDRTVRRHVLCLSCLFLFSKEAVGFFKFYFFYFLILFRVTNIRRIIGQVHIIIKETKPKFATITGTSNSTSIAFAVILITKMSKTSKSEKDTNTSSK